MCFSSACKLMIPPETIIFIASSEEILVKEISFFGANTRYPEVGFGVVGT